jgi:hypothetical protein
MERHTLTQPDAELATIGLPGPSFGEVGEGPAVFAEERKAFDAQARGQVLETEVRPLDTFRKSDCERCGSGSVRDRVWSARREEDR